MTDDSIETQVALIDQKLDTHIYQLKTYHRELRAYVIDNGEQHQEIQEEVKVLTALMAKYKSTFGGVVLTLSAMWAFVLVAWNWVTDK